MHKTSIIECDKCHIPMRPIHSEKVRVEPDLNSLTEGQLADYLASEEFDRPDDWGAIETTYKCPKCGAIVLVQWV